MNKKKLVLTGNLHPELTVLGLKAGDEFTNYSGPHKNGAVHFLFTGTAVPQNCSAWADNYKIV